MTTNDHDDDLAYLAAPPDDTDTRNIAAEVRKMLANGAKLTRDDMQAELGEPRVPLGQIAAALDEIGATVDSEERWSLRSREDVEALASRRADVLEAMFSLARSDDPVTAQMLADCTEGGDMLDVIIEAADALVEAGALCRHDDTGAITYDLGDGIYEKILRQGALFIARATLPELSAVSPGDSAKAALDAEQAAHTATKGTLRAAEQRIERLLSWLSGNGLPDPSIAPAAPEPMVVQWMRQRSRLEDLPRLVDERAALEAAIKAEEDEGKEDKKSRDGRIEKLKNKLSAVISQMTGGPIYFIDKSVTKTLEGGRFRVLSADSHDKGTFLGWDDEGATAAPAPPMFPAKGTEAAPPSPKAESVAPAPVDAAAEASTEATDEQEQRAAAVREATAAKWLDAAKGLLQVMGSLDWGKDGAAAVNSLARSVHGKERGKLPAGFAESARAALMTLLADGRAVMSGTGDAIVWADTSDKAAE